VDPINLGENLSPTRKK